MQLHTTGTLTRQVLFLCVLILSVSHKVGTLACPHITLHMLVHNQDSLPPAIEFYRQAQWATCPHQMQPTSPFTNYSVSGTLDGTQTANAPLPAPPFLHLHLPPPARFCGKTFCIQGIQTAYGLHTPRPPKSYWTLSAHPDPLRAIGHLVHTHTPKSYWTLNAHPDPQELLDTQCTPRPPSVMFSSWCLYGVCVCVCQDLNKDIIVHVCKCFL